MMAARRGDAKEILELALAGADPNCRGEEGETPLAEAALMGNEKALEALLESGAMAGAQGTFGKTAEDLARAAGHEECERLLERRRVSAQERAKLGEGVRAEGAGEKRSRRL